MSCIQISKDFRDWKLQGGGQDQERESKQRLTTLPTWTRDVAAHADGVARDMFIIYLRKN